MANTFCPPGRGKRPNLLYVFADQWRAAAMGWMGQDQAVTPAIDRFAGESLRCRKAYSTFPLCSPHRASLMTGKYPLRTGIWTNCKTGLEEILMLKPQERCIGNVLKENGYRTGYIGKWHLDAPEQNFCDKPLSGAREWDAYTPPGERRQGFDYWLSYGADDNHLNPHYWQDNEQPIRPGRWSAEFETDHALEFLEKSRGREEPFALFVSYNPPHLPYELVPDKYYDGFKGLKIHYRDNVPENLREAGGLLETQTRQYLAAVCGIDEQFGRLLDFLRENGMEEDTLVVLSADHGEMLGSHGLMSKNVWYEEAIHIPLLFRQKGRLPATDYGELFASVDHMPTLLGLLDLPVPDTCDGYDHTRSMQGCAQDAPQDMFLCSFPGGAGMVAAFAERGLTHKAYGWRGIKDKRYTYCVYNGYTPGEEQREYLYDSDTDPFEQAPRLLPERCGEEQIRRYRSRLREYLHRTGDPFLMPGIQ